VAAIGSALVHHHAAQLVLKVAGISNRTARWLYAIRRDIEQLRDRDRRVEFRREPSPLVVFEALERQDEILGQGRDLDLLAAKDQKLSERWQVVRVGHALWFHEACKARLQRLPFNLEL
jgi:hypothetical protein